MKNEIAKRKKRFLPEAVTDLITDPEKIFPSFPLVPAIFL